MIEETLSPNSLQVSENEEINELPANVYICLICFCGIVVTDCDLLDKTYVVRVKIVIYAVWNS